MNRLAVAGMGIACLVAGIIALSITAGAQNRFEGQWYVDFDAARGALDLVQVRFRYESERGGSSDNSRSIRRDALIGLSEAQARQSGGGAVQFQIRRDAGSFQCEGWFRAGK